VSPRSVSIPMVQWWTTCEELHMPIGVDGLVNEFISGCKPCASKGCQPECHPAQISIQGLPLTETQRICNRMPTLQQLGRLGLCSGCLFVEMVLPCLRGRINMIERHVILLEELDDLRAAMKESVRHWEFLKVFFCHKLLKLQSSWYLNPPPLNAQEDLLSCQEPTKRLGSWEAFCFHRLRTSTSQDVRNVGWIRDANQILKRVSGLWTLGLLGMQSLTTNRMKWQGQRETLTAFENVFCLWSRDFVVQCAHVKAFAGRLSPTRGCPFTSFPLSSSLAWATRQPSSSAARGFFSSKVAGFIRPRRVYSSARHRVTFWMEARNVRTFWISNNSITSNPKRRERHDWWFKKSHVRDRHSKSEPHAAWTKRSGVDE
jgi:hypothetical protein